MSTVAELLAVTVDKKVHAPPPAAAQEPSPRQNVDALADVPEFKFVTGKFPVTPVDKGIFEIVLLEPLMVLLVSVLVLVAVTTFVGVMIPDSATVAMIKLLYVRLALPDKPQPLQQSRLYCRLQQH